MAYLWLLLCVTIAVFDCYKTENCGVNEQWTVCPTPCGEYCPASKSSITDEVLCVTPEACPEDACQCIFNYRRLSNGTCVPTQQCPPVDCASPNEYFDPCPPLCPTDDCSNATPDGLCVQLPFINIVLPCAPRCRCVKGYWRKNGDCVPYRLCYLRHLLGPSHRPFIVDEHSLQNLHHLPPTTPHNVAKPLRCNRPNEVAACVYSCPPERTCRNRGIYFSCRNKGDCQEECRCKDGYFRNPLGDCITGNECDMCPGDNEFFSCGQECDNVCTELKMQNRTNCPIDNIVCNKKCYCEDGFARDENKKCVPMEKCSEQGNILARVEREVHHEKCSQNEEYVSCKRSCPPETCLSLVAKFKCNANEPCRPRCACKKGFLRHNTGEPCEPVRQCPELVHSPDFNK
ncbi:fibulin-1-like [Plodia interpunctella]|uniref:fibulin-1-like n=1 Tax=Plodia interpunctella TaxID=58824 RepID=UPI002368B62B|nr:fibulin-1-like [Plodia interpunctella]